MNRLPAIFGFLGVTVIAAVLMASIQFNANNPYLSEYDGYYHVKMAEVIRDNGIIQTFPWMQFTTLRDNFVDHHFLFHVLLLPFITIFGSITGAKLAIVCIVAAAFGVLYLLYRKVNVPLPLVASLVTLFLLAGDFYFRLNFVRNMGLSLLLLLLGILATLRNKPLWVGIITYLYGLAYGGAFFLPLFVIILVITQFLCGEKAQWKLIWAALIGLAAGLIISPYFPSNIPFLFLQIFQTGLGAQQYTGGEWQPYDTWYWGTTNAAPLAAFFGAVTLSFIHHHKQTTASIALFVLSIIFLLLVWKSKRFVEYSPFFLFLSAFALTSEFLREKVAEWKEKTLFKKMPNTVYIALLILLAPFAWSFAGEQTGRARTDTQTLFSMSALTQAHEYIKANSQEGDIVFTDDWDVFPRYFFVNSKNYYIVGLDPEFMNQYSGEPYPDRPGKLYREFADISSGSDATNLERIKTNFRARWVIVNSDHPEFYTNLQHRPDLFEEVLFAKNDPTADRYPNAAEDGYHVFRVL